MRSIYAIAIVIGLSGVLSLAQQDDWNRLISSGDDAMSKHQYAAAEGSYREALKVAEQHWKKDARISPSLIKLAESCNAQPKKDEAEALASRAVASSDEAQKAFKPKSVEQEFVKADATARLLDRAGDIFATNQKYSEAEKLYRRVIAIRKEYAEKKPPDRPTDDDYIRFFVQIATSSIVKVADAEDKLAGLYVRENKLQQAIELYRKVETIREKEFGPDKPPVASSLHNLATCYSLMGQYDQAEPLYKRALVILENSDYKDDPRTASILENYALLLRKTSREIEANQLSEKASAIRDKSKSPPPQ